MCVGRGRGGGGGGEKSRSNFKKSKITNSHCFFVLFFQETKLTV